MSLSEQKLLQGRFWGLSASGAALRGWAAPSRQPLLSDSLLRHCTFQAGAGTGGPAGWGGCSAGMALSWVWQAPGAGSSRRPPPAPRFPVGVGRWVGPPGPPCLCQGPSIPQRPEAGWRPLFNTESRIAVCPLTPLFTQGTREFRDRTARWLSPTLHSEGRGCHCIVPRFLQSFRDSGRWGWLVVGRAVSKASSAGRGEPELSTDSTAAGGRLPARGADRAGSAPENENKQDFLIFHSNQGQSRRLENILVFGQTSREMGLGSPGRM